MAITVGSGSAARNGKKRVFTRLGAAAGKPLKVCYYWRAGRCNRNPCPFLHRELPPPPGDNRIGAKRAHLPADDRSFSHPPSNPKLRLASNTWVRKHHDGLDAAPCKRQDKNHDEGLDTVPPNLQLASNTCVQNHCDGLDTAPQTTQDKNHGEGLDTIPRKMQDKSHGDGLDTVPCKTEDKKHGDGLDTAPHKSQDKNHGAGLAIVPHKVQDKVCHYWLSGNCSYGDKCKNLHSWFLSDSFALLAQLEGHQQVISGVTLPAGSDKLYSGSKDQSLRVWDCHTGQCSAVVNLGGEIGCMMSEGPWLFVGIPNTVKVWNTQTGSEFSLSGPVGQVHSLATVNEILFAGNQDGKVLAWKFDTASNCFQPAASLEGHSLAVVSLVIGANRLYSGSMDHTIRVWDLETLQCTHTLTGHTSAVMSVLCWDQFLLSCSLDKTIKAWAATESGDIDVIHTHNEKNGVLTLCGVHDAQAKPVLMCSYDDNTVHIYDLPSFNERGRIFSKEEVRTVQIGPAGLFFTGDGTGELRVWRWASE